MSNIDADILQIGTGVPYNNSISSISGTNTVFNSNKLNIDFEVRGTGTYSTLYYDASAGRLGVGTGLPDAVLHVVAPCSKDGLIIESVTNCPTGVTLLLLHNPQTPPISGSYPAIINLAGRDNNYNEINYAQIKSRVLSPNSTSTSGEILFLVDHTGVNKEVFVAGLTNLVLGANNQVSGYSYQVLGQKNIGSGNFYIYIGSNNSGVTIDNSLLIGDNNTYSGPKLFSIANNSKINGSGSFVLGSNNISSGISSTVCGSNTTSSGSYNLLFANNSNLNSSYIIGMIQNGTISGVSGIVLGTNVFSSGHNNINIGNNNRAAGNDSSIVGSSVSSSGSRNIIFGNYISNSGNNLISIGSNQTSSNIDNGIFIGNDFDLTNAKNVLYVGFNNTTESGLNNSVVIGANNDLDNNYISDVVLLGQYNITNAIDSSVIIGNTNNASGTLKNNIILGSGNAIVNNSSNNILVGALNNQTGIYINSQGEIFGTPTFVNSNSVNSIAIGTHNVGRLNNSNITIGNKNLTSGVNLNLLGSFNIARNTSGSYILGNSNYIEGENILALGKNILGLGKNIIAVNNSNSNMGVYGSGSIGIGNNLMIYSGITIGQNNNLYGLSGLIYGNNNTLGFIVNSFTFSPSEPNIINVQGVWPGVYNQFDMVLAQVMNPTGPDNLYAFTIGELSTNNITFTTRLSIQGTLTLDSGRLYTVNNTFDDNNPFINTMSGIIMPLYSHQSNKYFGLNNIVVGRSNNVIYSNNIVLGNNNIASGDRSVIIGNNITSTLDNSVSIGSSDTNKVVFDNQQIVFNTGTTQQQIVTRSNNGAVSSYHDLINSRLGINTTSPRSSLDVSGTITSSSLRMGLSSISGYVLTTDSNGVGSWQFPVNLSGTDNGLLYKVSNKVASGITDITYIRTNDGGSGINFYDNVYLMNTGLIINPDRFSNNNAIDLVVWGSGGEFAPKLLELVASKNLANMYHLSATSGGFDKLSASQNVKLPSNLTGTFLYVNNSGDLLSASLPPNSVVFGSSNSWASGNRKFRWIDSQASLTISTGINITTDEIITNGRGENDNSTYNVILSANNNINTVFNNQGLMSEFSVYRAGLPGTSTKQGFHILSNDGKVGIDTTITNLSNQDSKLLVNGKIAADSFKLNTPVTPGQYLQVTTDGNISPAPISINASFTGIYPVLVSTDSATNRVRVELSRYRPNTETDFSSADLGRALVLSTNGWSPSTGLQVFHPNSRNDKGVLLGYGGSLTFQTDTVQLGAPTLNNGIVYAGGAFTSSTDRLGSSQFNQFFLRGRTSNGNKTILTMNWDNNNSNTWGTNDSFNNIMRLRGDRDTVWTYQIFVSCLWQSGTTNVKGGLGFVAQGTVTRIPTNSVLPVMVTGNSSIIKHRNAGDPNFDIFIQPDTITTSTDTVLHIAVSGSAGFNCLWSATALINQVQWTSTNY